MRVFSLALLLASACSQIFAREFDCNRPLPFIFTLGNASCPCDRAEHTGELKYENGKVSVCLGSEWKTFPFEESYAYGTENNPGYSCKDILENAGQQPSDGVYWIRLRGKPAVLILYLLFKGDRV